MGNIKEQIRKYLVGNPYIFVIENKTDKVIENIELLSACTRQFLPSTDAGYEHEDYSIKYGIPNITYQQVLGSVSAGLVIQAAAIKIKSDSIKQMETRLHYEQKKIDGDYNGGQIYPFTLDYFEDKDKFGVAEFDQIINGTTSLELTELLPNAVVVISIYPKKK